MSKNDPIESALNALGDLRLATSSDDVEKQLRSYLAHRSNLVVAKAAKIAVELQMKAATQELVAAFDRLYCEFEIVEAANCDAFSTEGIGNRGQVGPRQHR